MASNNLKVNISNEKYNAIKNLPEGVQEAELTKAVIEAARRAGYEKADLLKETTTFGYRIDAQSGRIEKSSKKSTVIDSMVSDIKKLKEKEVAEEEKQKEQEDSKDENEKDENEESQEQEKTQNNAQVNKDKRGFSVSFSQEEVDEILSKSEEDAKSCIHNKIEQSAKAQSFDVSKLENSKKDTLSIGDAATKQSRQSKTNNMNLLKALTEVIYAGLKGMTLDEQADAVEQANDNTIPEKNETERAIDSMVAPQADNKLSEHDAQNQRVLGNNPN